MSTPRVLFPLTNKTFKHAEWGLLDQDDVPLLSTCRVTQSSREFLAPEDAQETLCDRRMSPCLENETCRTCKKAYGECPGHIGYISLPTPILPSHFIPQIKSVLASICVSTSGCKGVINQKRCSVCLNHAPKIEEEGGTGNFIVVQTNGAERKLHADDVLRILKDMTDDQIKFAGMCPKKAHPKNLVWKYLPVLPPLGRPYRRVSSTRIEPHPLTGYYATILKIISETETASPVVQMYLRVDLQRAVSLVADASSVNTTISAPQRTYKKTNKTSALGLADATGRKSFFSVPSHGKGYEGMAQRLEGKGGRFRKTILGGTCEFSARSVVIGGSALRIDEIGVPKEIADVLSVPEYVTKINFKTVQKWLEDGRINAVTKSSREFKKGNTTACIGDVVHRKLQNGDLVLFNRQPTLHRHSMMAFRAVLVEGRAFQLNPMTCVGFNADFDGDEMNLHVPQTLQARAEAENLMHIRWNAMSSQNSLPVVGLMMDALISCYFLSSKSTFLEWENVQQFVSAADIWVNVPPPTVFTKERQLWTGLDAVSAFFPADFSFSTATWGEHGWGRDDFGDKEHEGILMRQGRFIKGSLTKSTIGAAPHGLVEALYKLASPRTCLDLLSNLQRAANWWLQQRGFTLGYEETYGDATMARTYTEKIRKKAHQQPATKDGYAVMDSVRNSNGEEFIERLPQPNAIFDMVACGSKGKITNTINMGVSLGMQNVGGGPPAAFGRRPRSSLHYAPGDDCTAARGFVSSSFFTGLTVPEFVFHAMWARVAIVDVSSKTKDVGYDARKLMKTMQDAVVAYDGTVRFTSTNRIIQYSYGGTGLPPEALMLDPKTQLMKPFSSSEELQKVSPGEPVGCHAADCTAQPMTQTALGTYHHAGQSLKRVTGYPRVEELYRATTNESVMTIEFPPQTNVTHLSRVRVRDICKTIRIVREAPWWSDVYAECFWENPNKKRKEVNKKEKENETIILVTFSNDDLDTLGMRLRTIAKAFSKEGIRVTHTYETPKGERLFADIQPPEIAFFIENESPRKAVAKVLDQTVRGMPFFGAQFSGSEIVCASTLASAIQAFRYALKQNPNAKCSSVFATLRVLGVQAARECIIEELQRAYSADGSNPVATTHVLLLADCMTALGAPLGTSSNGSSAMNGSALHRAGFERVNEVINKAAFTGESDACNAVASKITLGAPIPLGTGYSFTMAFDETVLEKHVQDHEEIKLAQTLDFTTPTFMSFNPFTTDDINAYIPSTPLFSQPVLADSITPKNDTHGGETKEEEVEGGYFTFD